MSRLVATWAREHRWSWLAGVGLWLVIAAAGGALAGSLGKPAWPYIVTLDEWVVALGLLTRLVIPLISPVNSGGVWAQIAAQRRAATAMGGGMRTVVLITQFTWALAVVFLLDLFARAVLGLGLTAF